MKKSLVTIGSIAALAIASAPANADHKTFGDGVLPDFLAQYDVNEDGTIDEEERQAIKEARAAARAERIAEFDTDEDGELSDEEKAAAKEAVRAEIEARRAEKFSTIAGEDALISPEEFAAVPGLEEANADRVAALFARLDADDSGAVSLDEFTARLRNHRGNSHGRGDSPKSRGNNDRTIPEGPSLTGADKTVVSLFRHSE